MYVDRTYYLAPDGDDEAYAVLREALRRQVGLGKLALYGREYLVAVRRQARGLVLHTLHHAAEIRSFDVAGELPSALIAAPGAIRLARQVIASLEGPLNLGDFIDDYQAGVRQLIAAKIAGKEIVMPPPIATPTAAATLMEALTQSLAALSAPKANGIMTKTARHARRMREAG
jgi:DNA end-binding protein Ku